MSIEFISSGFKPLDSILEVGGFPKGGIVEITGEAGSGKTRIALRLVAEAQRMGVSCVFMSLESDPFDLVSNLVRNRGVGLVVLELGSHQPCPPWEALTALAPATYALGSLVVVTHRGNSGLPIRFERLACVRLRCQPLVATDERGAPVTTGTRVTVTKNRYGELNNPQVDLRFRSDQDEHDCDPWLDAPLTPEEAETIAKVTPDSPDSVPWD